MNYPVQERPIEPSMLPYASPYEAAPMPADYALTGGNDSISRFQIPYGNSGQQQGQSDWGPLGGLGNMLQGLWQMLPPSMAMNSFQAFMQQMLQYFQSQPNAYGDQEQYYANANGGSNGDPHLSFNGQTWDNMGSQPDLLHSNSFPGGFQLSTQTTQPGPNGVTFNQSATLTTNYGQTAVTLDKDGNATITQEGYSYPLQAGQSMDLENGEFVQRNADGSLQITCNNGQGGQITTTMRENGQGVDVNASANNVDLGGTLVNGNGGIHYHPHPHPHPWPPGGIMEPMARGAVP